MDFTDEQHTKRYPASEKPGEAGLYKRFAANPNTDEEIVHYCLFDDGWWYEGSVVSSSALNMPLRKSHFQDDGFEWCGVMPGSYERPDVQAVKADIFAGNFFGMGELTEAIGKMSDGDADFESKIKPGDVTAAAAQVQLDLEEPASISEEQQFNADFFGEQP